jgi:anthranilate 1,2-dioxygenase small subunit
MFDDALLSRLRSFYDLGACQLDELELEAWATNFTQDGLYELISRENFDQGLPHATIYCEGMPMIEDRVTSIREAIIYEDRYLRHFISSVRANRREGEILHAQASFLLFESIADRAPETIMVGRYVDELVERDGGFAIRRRRAVFDNYFMPRSIVIPV